MNRISRFVQASIAAVLLLLAVPSAVHADSSDAITFETVDSVVYLDNQGLAVTGIPAGQTQAVEHQFFFYASVGSSDCHKQALLAMDRPGRYRLTFESRGGVSYSCRLTRR